MRNDILVSVIIPTKNSAQVIDKTLESVSSQTYKNIEIICIDNHSLDQTKLIASRYTNNIFDIGPERCTQRNYGVKKSRGRYVLVIDSDMILDQDLIQDCISKITGDPGIKGIYIPMQSFGSGFWSRCKTLEQNFYYHLPYMDIIRFFERNSFNAINGYDVGLISGDDWDITYRFKKRFQVGYTDKYIYHNEGNLTLANDLYKKFYYSKHIHKYLKKNYLHDQISPVKRFCLYLKSPKTLFNEPLVGLGLLYMKFLEYLVGGIGISITYIKNNFTK